ncbi:MAG TPA: hypothetical protein VND64_03615 [Pirellulales bacterium]|nr:hypothetical protein [Pirellulales bacterium]
MQWFSRDTRPLSLTMTLAEQLELNQVNGAIAVSAAGNHRTDASHFSQDLDSASLDGIVTPCFLDRLGKSLSIPLLAASRRSRFDVRQYLLLLLVVCSATAPSQLLADDPPPKSTRLPPEFKKMPKSKKSQVSAPETDTAPKSLAERRKEADALVIKYDQEARKKSKALEQKCEQLRKKLNKASNVTDKAYGRISDQLKAAERNLQDFHGQLRQRNVMLFTKYLARILHIRYFMAIY